MEGETNLYDHHITNDGLKRSKALQCYKMKRNIYLCSLKVQDEKNFVIGHLAELMIKLDKQYRSNKTL